MRSLLLLTLLSIAASSVDAQNCKKGCRCGGACISCSKTCRIGSSGGGSIGIDGSSRTTPKPSTTEPSRSILSAPAKDSGTKGPLPYRGRWFGSSANHFYFRDGCPIEKLLAVGDQVVLPDSVSAETIGFRRLSMPGC